MQWLARTVKAQLCSFYAATKQPSQQQEADALLQAAREGEGVVVQKPTIMGQLLTHERDSKQPAKYKGGEEHLTEQEKELAAQATIRVSWVLLPILFLSNALGHFEKGNLAFAALQLNKQMGFSALEYGVGSGLYFLGYGVGIVPSTFATIRYGARRWLGVMTVLCGVMGMSHALIHNRTSFYVLRCFLGLLEAGTGSSAGHLLAQFYPKSRLAKPFTVIMLSYFSAGILAAPLATGLMSLDGKAGLHGWQWLFIAEAIPALLMGVVILAWLPSHPLTAWMLSPQQREALHLKVQGSHEEADAARTPPKWSQLFVIVWRTTQRPLLWFLTFASMLHGLAFFSFGPWVTILINNMLHGTALQHSTSSGDGPMPHGDRTGHAGQHGRLPYKAILLSSVPAVTGSIMAVIVAWHSDRRNEKPLHIAVPWLVAGVLLTLFGPSMQASFAAGFAVLVLAKTFASASSGVSSSLMVGCLDIKHAGVGLALSHAVTATVSGFAGPVFVGAVVQRTGSFGQAMVCNGLLHVAAAALMFGLAAWDRGYLQPLLPAWCCFKAPEQKPGGSSSSSGGKDCSLLAAGSLQEPSATGAGGIPAFVDVEKGSARHRGSDDDLQALPQALTDCRGNAYARSSYGSSGSSSSSAGASGSGGSSIGNASGSIGSSSMSSSLGRLSDLESAVELSSTACGSSGTAGRSSHSSGSSSASKDAGTHSTAARQ